MTFKLCLLNSAALAALMLTAVCISENAAAQSQAKPPPTAIVHQPPKVENLPYPGQNLSLVAKLTNTRDTNRKMVVTAVRDGRFIQVYAKEAYLNEYDQPTYEIQLPAPVAEMTYQLLLLASTSQVLSTPRYVLRRNCLPQVEPAEALVPANVRGMERLQKLINQSDSLLNDLAGYERVMHLLEELKGKVGQ